MYASFLSWRRSHAVHHATAGDLDRRGVGDVPTLTVAEYRAIVVAGAIGYRLFRNPLVMFGLGPLYALVLHPRLVPRSAAAAHPAQRDRHGRRAGGGGGRAVLAGRVAEFLLVQTPVAAARRRGGRLALLRPAPVRGHLLAERRRLELRRRRAAGQQLPEAAARAAVFSGNIGLHHVHHLSAKVPNYNLQRAHDQNPIFHDVPTLSLWDGLRAVRFKLWDERRGRLVTFAEARANPWPIATTSSSPTR